MPDVDDPAAATPTAAGPPAAAGRVVAGEPLATERLDLTPLRVADADEMVAVLADPALYGFIGGDPPTRAELVARYRAQIAGPPADRGETWHNWIVRDRASGSAAGFVQVTLVEPGDGAPSSAEIAWLIGTRWQGRGYAAEAARELVAWLVARGVQAIVAHVHPNHAASEAVAERAGLSLTDELVDGERTWRGVFIRA